VAAETEIFMVAAEAAFYTFFDHHFIVALYPTFGMFNMTFLAEFFFMAGVAGFRESFGACFM
jgi:hypothetical protein